MPVNTHSTKNSPGLVINSHFQVPSPRVLLSELQRKVAQCQVCRARLGGPRILSKTADKNLDCALVENPLFSPILNCNMSTEHTIKDRKV